MATELADGVCRFDCREVNAYLVSKDVPTLVDAGTLAALAPDLAAHADRI